MKHVDALSPFIYAGVLFGLALLTLTVHELLQNSASIRLTIGARGLLLLFFPLLAGAILWWPVVALAQSSKPASATALGSHLWRCFFLYLCVLGAITFFARGINAWPATAWITMFGAGSLAGIAVDFFRGRRSRRSHAAA